MTSLRTSVWDDLYVEATIRNPSFDKFTAPCCYRHCLISVLRTEYMVPVLSYMNSISQHMFAGSLGVPPANNLPVLHRCTRYRNWSSKFRYVAEIENFGDVRSYRERKSDLQRNIGLILSHGLKASLASVPLHFWRRWSRRDGLVAHLN